MPIHPTQIYMSMNALIIFLISHFIINKRKKFHGETTFVLCILYAIGRSIIEVFRGDFRRGFVFEADILPPVGPDIFSTSQLIGIFVIIISIFMLIWLRKEGEGELRESAKRRMGERGKGKKRLKTI